METNAGVCPKEGKHMNKNVADDALRGLLNRRMPAWARYVLVLLVPVCRNGRSASVPVEIQLRTPAMDMWACVEHDLCYKPVKEA